MTKALVTPTEGEVELDKRGISKKTNKHTRHQRTTLKLVLTLIAMISVVGWLLLERMEADLTTNLRHEIQHAPVLIRSSQQVVQDEESKTSSSQMPTLKRFAYFFYVTSDTYACAAIQFINRLTTKLEMNTTSIDVVVMHTRRIGDRLLSKMQGLHVRTIEVESIHADASEWTWKESLTKLRVFQDWGYSRVVFFDADAVPMVNLDHLFDLPPATLYAPTAYWLEQPFFASTMLVIEPSENVFNDVVQWARDRGAAAGFDMDILNSYFKDSVHYLPGIYTILNSDFRRAPSGKSSLFNTTAELKEHTKVVHFSCKPNGEYGKPWDWPTHDLSLLEGEGFDPLFEELFQQYWRGEEEQCSG